MPIRNGETPNYTPELRENETRQLMYNEMVFRGTADEMHQAAIEIQRDSEESAVTIIDDGNGNVRMLSRHLPEVAPLKEGEMPGWILDLKRNN